MIMFPYNLQNYHPGPFAPRPSPTPATIPDSVKQRARAQGATDINQDGSRAYCWRYDQMFYSNAPDFESWFPVVGDLPAEELIEL